MKILIMKFRNIGDVLLTTPLIKNLKLNYPNAIIDFALNKGTEEMLTLNPNINKIHIYNREKIKKLPLIKKILQEIKFVNKIRKNKYDIVINTTEGDRGAIISWFSKATKKFGYPNIKNKFLKNIYTQELPSQELRHIIETNLDVLRVLNLPVKEKKVEIFWDKKDEEKINSIVKTKEFLHIHPVSRWLFKCINDITMAKIIDFCKDELKIEVFLTAAPQKQELEKINSILKLCKSKPLNLSGKLTLKQTAALNKQAKFFIGVDTAIMHISAANNTPVLAFFGPSGADHWGPWDNNMIKSGYISRRGFRGMGRHRVIQKNWDCVPCGEDGCNGTKISDCLTNLNFEFIKKNIKEMVSE